MNDEAIKQQLEDVDWLGKEKPPLGAENELDGIAAILKSLDQQEIDQIKELDTTYPIRYFRANKGNIEKSVQAIRKTLAFRKEFGMDQIIHAEGEMLENLTQDAHSARIYVRGYTQEGRAILITQSHPVCLRNDEYTLKFCFWSMEKAIACTRRKSGLEKIVVVQNFAGFDNKYGWPFAMSKQIIAINQHHYPERAYKIYYVDAPLAFRVLWTMLYPFVDSDTRAKITFCNSADMSSFVATAEDKEKLEQFMGGETPVREFDADEYMSLPFDVTFDER